jgi:16S rRNA processing protein RimM
MMAQKLLNLQKKQKHNQFIMIDSEKYSLCAVILAAQDLDSSVKVKPFVENHKVITLKEIYFDDGTIAKITSSRPKNDTLIIKIENINNRTDAEKLKGRKLYILKENLPILNNDEYYYNQLIGLILIDNNNNKIGTIVGVYNFGAGDIVEYEDIASNNLEMIPFNNNVFTNIDLKNKTCTISLPEII